MIDLTDAAGFPLSFDPATLAITTKPADRFREKSRSVSEMSAVLDDPADTDPQMEVYRTYLPESVPEPAASSLAAHDLTYSLVAVRPIRIGAEAGKTYGHLHPRFAGTGLTSPEIYAQIHGRLVVMLQKHDAVDPTIVREFVAIELGPGQAALIPPGYAHALANPFDEPGLLAGLYADPKHFPADYRPMEQRHGMAWRVRPTTDSWDLAPNPAYDHVPARRFVGAIGTEFEADAAWLPLWQAAERKPQAFRFLSVAEVALARFGDPFGADHRAEGEAR